VSTTSLLRRAGGTLAILGELPGQRRIPYAPPERIAELRDRRVRELIAFAIVHVPHYRDLGLDPREIRAAGDLAKLPLIDKHAIQADPERFRPNTPDRDDVRPFRTAGSTGIPLTIPHDRRSLLANIAWGERERAAEVLLCGQRYSYDVLQITHPGSADRRVREYYDRVSFRPLRPRLHAATVADSIDALLERLNRLRPPVVRGFGTHLDLFFATLVARGDTFHRPRVVVYGGDAMPERCKRLLGELGIPVLSRYGASEAMKIGYTCEAGADGFHLHEDLTHVVVDAPDGETGELVISNLVNRGLVLLNYRLGDLGRLGGRDCSCGRTALLLTGLEGRVDETIRLPDGASVHPVLVRVACDTSRDVLRFQVVQEAPDRFRVKLVVADPSRFDDVAWIVLKALDRVLPGCRIECERHDELALEPGARKFHAVVPLRESGQPR
jgi:phenylacetate-CoA ligase